MKRPQIKFHVDTVCGYKVMRLKNSKFVVRSKSLAAQFFLFIYISLKLL